MTTVISVEHLSKSYRLGQIGTGTFAHDLSVWWANVRGKANPLLRIGETDHGNRDGEEIWALRDVSFTVEQGEVLGIIGRNGAGKSTLLKILSRVTAPTSGRIKVKGRVASLLEVGTGFHPELTGRENVYLNGAILGMSKAEVARKFDEIVDFSGVEQFIDTPVKRYSSGMYVRLAFAVAAHLEPEILVVDEVLAVGDAEFQKKCLGKMDEVAKKGRTVLFVSHNMGAVSALCSESICLERGTISFIGKSNDAIQHYLSASTAMKLITKNARDENIKAIVSIVGFFAKNIHGQAIDDLISGQDVCFEIEYETQIHEVTQVVCMLNFRTLLGQPLFSCNTRIFGEYLSLKGPNGKIVCVVPEIPLNQGSYYIDIALKQGTSKDSLLDELLQPVNINVIAGDFFETGRTANLNSSPCLVRHKWLVRS